MDVVILTIQELVVLAMILMIPVIAPIKIVLGLFSVAFENIGGFITGMF